MSELDPRPAGLSRAMQHPASARFAPYGGGDVVLQSGPVLNGFEAPMQQAFGGARMQLEGVSTREEDNQGYPPADTAGDQGQRAAENQRDQAADDEEQAEVQKILQERERIVEEHAKQQRVHDKKVVEWTRYYADLRDYMIRYSGHHAGQQTQRSVEEQFALRAAQAAVATAQHIAGYERNAQKERERAQQREREAAKKPVMM
ncbi:hypothetical protein DIPPA_34161 [Diplonema papillatum]|nr:hypothetical protein DIPPA_34161 [Diplonema papillatum]